MGRLLSPKYIVFVYTVQRERESVKRTMRREIMYEAIDEHREIMLA